jgi:hypothetical protein
VADESRILRFGITIDGERARWWRLRSGAKSAELYLEASTAVVSTARNSRHDLATIVWATPRCSLHRAVEDRFVCPRPS